MAPLQCGRVDTGHGRQKNPWMRATRTGSAPAIKTNPLPMLRDNTRGRPLRGWKVPRRRRRLEPACENRVDLDFEGTDIAGARAIAIAILRPRHAPLVRRGTVRLTSTVDGTGARCWTVRLRESAVIGQRQQRRHHVELVVRLRRELLAALRIANDVAAHRKAVVAVRNACNRLREIAGQLGVRQIGQAGTAMDVAYAAGQRKRHAGDAAVERDGAVEDVQPREAVVGDRPDRAAAVSRQRHVLQERRRTDVENHRPDIAPP